MTRRECLPGMAVQAALIVLPMFGACMTPPCQAQVDPALQQSASQVTVVWGDPVTGVARDINVGQKLPGIEALREQLLSDLMPRLNTVWNGTPTGQDVSELRTIADKVDKLAAYCRNLADRVEQQRPGSRTLSDWLRANELILRSWSATYFSGTPITQSRLLTGLDEIEQKGSIRSDARMGAEINAIRFESGYAETYACEGRRVRNLLSYTPAGIGVDVFRITAAPDSVPQGDPVQIGLTLTMLGGGDCRGENLMFELQPAPGKPILQRRVTYPPGDQRYEQNFFAVDTKGLQPGTYPVVARVSYLAADAAGGWLPQFVSKTANASFVVTGTAAGPANSTPPQTPGKPQVYRGHFNGRDELHLRIDYSSGTPKVVSGFLLCHHYNTDGSRTDVYYDVMPGPAGGPDFTILQRDTRSPSGWGRFSQGAPALRIQNFQIALSLTGRTPWSGIVMLDYDATASILGQ